MLLLLWKRTSPPRYFSPFLDLPHVWYLSEIDDGPLKVLAKTIVTLSPRKRSVSQVRYLCMPTWAFEEILECRKEIFSHLPEELVSELFDKVVEAFYLTHHWIVSKEL